MRTVTQQAVAGPLAHPWLRQARVAFVPGPTDSLLQHVSTRLLQQFRRQGHVVQDVPDDDTDLILSTAPFGKPVGWRKSLLFAGRRRFKLRRLPTPFVLIHATSQEFKRLMDHFAAALAKEPLDSADFAFPGLMPCAHRVLFEQGHRGGPILALQRLLQAQAKSIRIILLVGEDAPHEAYHFDLVGAYPRSVATSPASFYEDIVLRVVTSVSAREVTHHEVVGELVPSSVWQDLATPAAMRVAGQKLGVRDFFTEMVLISNLVPVPAVSDAVASQYSEGCFSTWEPTLDALVATVTGSARPVDKGAITDDDLAVIVGVQPDGSGALVRHVEGKQNDPPSSEAVEMMDMNSPLPRIRLGPEWPVPVEVPVVRSRLHGHRGISAYDPRWVEYVPLDAPYFHYLVSCATDAQARGIKRACARSEALQNPEDPRQVVFTVLPGHGTFIVEKWVPGKVPFQVIWEYMDAGYLEVHNLIPQGPMQYVPGPHGRMVVQAVE